MSKRGFDRRATNKSEIKWENVFFLLGGGEGREKSRGRKANKKKLNFKKISPEER